MPLTPGALQLLNLLKGRALKRAERLFTEVPEADRQFPLNELSEALKARNSFLLPVQPSVKLSDDYSRLVAPYEPPMSRLATQSPADRETINWMRSRVSQGESPFFDQVPMVGVRQAPRSGGALQASGGDGRHRLLALAREGVSPSLIEIMNLSSLPASRRAALNRLYTQDSGRVFSDSGLKSRGVMSTEELMDRFQRQQGTLLDQFEARDVKLGSRGGFSRGGRVGPLSQLAGRLHA